MRATLRWAHADLRAHRGEALFFVLATAGVVAALLLAGTLFSYAANPWQRVFNASDGAHVRLELAAGSEADVLAGLNGVAGTAGPYRTAEVTVETRGVTARLELRGMGTRLPEVAVPQLDAGRWLTPDDTAGVVLERSMATELWIEPGAALTVAAPDGEAVALRVTGIAETADPPYEAGARPGIGWVLPGTLDRVGPALPGQTLGLRLQDPGDTDFLVQRAVTTLGPGQVEQVTKWQQARDAAGGTDRTLGLVFGGFGLGALLAAALAASGAIAARVRGQLRDIAVLKTIGFTPAQVVRIFLVQHLAFALIGVSLGTAALATLGRLLPGRVGDAAGLWRELPGGTAMLLAVPLASVLFIAAATSLAAWGAGRVSPVPAARATLPSGGPLSGLARRALGLRLPPALLLGWRSAFQRRRRTALGVARLAVPLALITVALSAWTTMDRFQSHPEQLGLPAALTARAADGAQPSALGDVSAHPAVAGVHPGAEVAALPPGQTGTLTLRGLGTAGAPYPFTLAEGHAPTGPDEAVAGQGMLDLLDAGVGDWVRMTVDGRPLVLHIVGRSIEPEKNGRIISTTLDTLQETDPSLRPGFHQLVLHPDADAEETRDALAGAVGEELDIQAVANPADALSPARTVIAGVIGVLALITLTELLTAVGAAVRDRGRDLLALKAIGLTPWQISGVIMAATGFTALAAAVLGTAVGALTGHWLIEAQAHWSGVGAGVAEPLGPSVVAAVIAASVLGAVAASAVPATRSARRRLADSLSETL